MLVVGNPASRGIRLSAHLAYRDAGVSVQGQLPHWRECPANPGKQTFWYEYLKEQGVDAGMAARLVADLNRIVHAW